MKVIRAEAMGLCFGVRDALEQTGTVPQADRVTIHGELVHNEAVKEQLKRRGFHMTPEAERKSVPETPQVLITAHGISDRERLRLESAGKRLIDTTCPLVRLVHESAQRLAAEGFFVIVIGRRGHVEVHGDHRRLAGLRSRRLKQRMSKPGRTNGWGLSVKRRPRPGKPSRSAAKSR